MPSRSPSRLVKDDLRPREGESPAPERLQLPEGEELPPGDEAYEGCAGRLRREPDRDGVPAADLLRLSRQQRDRRERKGDLAERDPGGRDGPGVGRRRLEGVE